MSVSEKHSQKFHSPPSGAAEAFHLIFRALPKKERIAVARYIFEDDDIRRCYDLPEIPNQTTLKAFAEDKSAMPVFHSVEDLKKDLMG